MATHSLIIAVPGAILRFVRTIAIPCFPCRRDMSAALIRPRAERLHTVAVVLARSSVRPKRFDLPTAQDSPKPQVSAFSRKELLHLIDDF